MTIVTQKSENGFIVQKQSIQGDNVAVVQELELTQAQAQRLLNQFINLGLRPGMYRQNNMVHFQTFKRKFRDVS